MSNKFHLHNQWQLSYFTILMKIIWYVSMKLNIHTKERKIQTNLPYMIFLPFLSSFSFESISTSWCGRHCGRHCGRSFSTTDSNSNSNNISIGCTCRKLVIWEIAGKGYVGIGTTVRRMMMLVCVPWTTTLKERTKTKTKIFLSVLTYNILYTYLSDDT